MKTPYVQTVMFPEAVSQSTPWFESMKPYSNEDGDSSDPVIADIERLYRMLTEVTKKYEELNKDHLALRTRTTLLESQFTTLRNLYYKKFEE